MSHKQNIKYVEAPFEPKLEENTSVKLIGLGGWEELSPDI